MMWRRWFFIPFFLYFSSFTHAVADEASNELERASQKTTQFFNRWLKEEEDSFATKVVLKEGEMKDVVTQLESAEQAQQLGELSISDRVNAERVDFVLGKRQLLKYVPLSVGLATGGFSYVKFKSPQIALQKRRLLIERTVHDYVASEINLMKSDPSYESPLARHPVETPEGLLYLEDFARGVVNPKIFERKFRVYVIELEAKLDRVLPGRWGFQLIHPTPSMVPLNPAVRSRLTDHFSTTPEELRARWLRENSHVAAGSAGIAAAAAALVVVILFNEFMDGPSSISVTPPCLHPWNNDGNVQPNIEFLQNLKREALRVKRNSNGTCGETESNPCIVHYLVPKGLAADARSLQGER